MDNNIKKFYENLNNEYIKISNVDVIKFMNLYQIKMKIEIPKLNLEFNYGASIPFTVTRLTKNLKESLINSLKLTIYEYIVKLTKLDKLGE